MNRKQRRLAAKQKRSNKAAFNVISVPDQVNRLLQQAGFHYNSGEFAAAERLLRQILDIIPDFTMAMYNLAGILLQEKRGKEALPLLEKLVQQRPDDAMLYYNLGVLYKELEQPTDALLAYQRAKELQPDDARIYVNIAAVLKQLNYLQEACDNCEIAVKLAPENLRALNNMGVILCELDRLDEALDVLDKAIAIDPDYASAYATRGLILTKMKSIEAAVAAYEQALLCDPNNAETLYNYGLLLERSGEHVAALEKYEKSIHLNPNFVSSYNGKGNCLKEAGDLAGAMACYDQVMVFEPDHVKAHFNKSLILLTQGNFKDGWREYLWRYKLPLESSPPYKFPKPHWCGDSFEGKTLLLHAEQGLGDVIQCLRYIPKVKAQGGRLLIQCQQPLKTLIQENYDVDGVYHRLEPLPPFDLHCPLLSLPGLYGANSDNVPYAGGYLKTSARIGFVRPGEFSVGLVWQGSIKNNYDRKRSIDLSMYEALSRIDGIKLVSLQYEDPRQQLEQVDWAGKIKRCDEWMIDMRHTAAIIKQLDLVITVDTSVAHLAGAMGKPAWVLLSMVPDWRWLMDGETTHWYHSLRLFRQTERGNWQEVIDRVYTALIRHQTSVSKISIAL